MNCLEVLCKKLFVLITQLSLALQCLNSLRRMHFAMRERDCAELLIHYFELRAKASLVCLVVWRDPLSRVNFPSLSSKHNLLISSEYNYDNERAGWEWELCIMHTSGSFFRYLSARTNYFQIISSYLTRLLSCALRFVCLFLYEGEVTWKWDCCMIR